MCKHKNIRHDLVLSKEKNIEPCSIQRREAAEMLNFPYDRGTIAQGCNTGQQLLTLFSHSNSAHMLLNCTSGQLAGLM